jgi:hypothetical protein
VARLKTIALKDALAFTIVSAQPGGSRPAFAANGADRRRRPDPRRARPSRPAPCILREEERHFGRGASALHRVGIFNMQVVAKPAPTPAKVAAPR